MIKSKEKGGCVSNSKNMATNGRVAVVSMEEEYMRLQIDYADSEDRTIICSTIDQVEKELDIYPEVMHKRNEQGGTYYIEFEKELYTTSRLPGEFIEKLLKDLHIERCEDR